VVRAIAREFSSDPDTYQSAGDLGWTPLGIHEDYEDKFWNLEPGTISKPTPNVENPQSVFFFLVSERDGNREVSRRNRETLKTRALQMWVNQERQNHDVYATFNSDIYAWFIEQLRISASTTPTPVTNPLQNILGGL
jgi:parvulin-like peptidyl-prolyl isomerase